MKEGWKIMSLGEVATFSRGLTYSKNDEADTSSKVVLRSNNVDLFTGKIILEDLKYLKETFDLPNDKIVKKGSLLMCMSNGSKCHLGKVALIDADYPYAFGGFMGMVTPCEDLNPMYFFYSLTSPSYKNFIKHLSEGANINNIKVRDLEKFEIPVPSLSEQQRIVEYLDSAFAKIDALKAKAKENLDNAQALFQAALTEMMTPKDDWIEKPMNEICDVITDYVAAGSFADIKKNVVYNDNPDYAQLVRTMDLKSNFSKGKMVYVSESAFKYLYRVNLDKESIVLPNVGVNCGEVYYVTPSTLPYANCVLAPNAILVRSSDYVNEYLAYAFQDDAFQKQLRDITSHMAQPKFNKTALRALTLFLPSLGEQENIVRKLNFFKGRITQLQKSLLNVSTECDALKQALLKQIFE